MIGTATTWVPKILVLLGHRNGFEFDLTFERPLVCMTSRGSNDFHYCFVVGFAGDGAGVSA
jgi:hypothetical protein